MRKIIALITLAVLSTPLIAQDFATGFMQGMREGQQDRLTQSQIEYLERQNRREREIEEREYQEWVNDQNDRVSGVEKRDPPDESEKAKNERIKLKLEALKMGYELTDDGNLKPLQKNKKP